MSRIKNSILNIKYAIIFQLLGLLISFISRMVFVKTLSAEYLGISGVFTNILSMLSLAELGIGSAIIYSLYRPLAERNQEKVYALMGLYKKAYIIIGCIIGIIGILLTPFLRFFIKDVPDIPNIHLIYVLYVINSSFSYFFSYKRSLIIADQKRYIATQYRYIFYYLLNVSQIFALLLTKNYIIYLILLIICTVLENLFITIKANKMYPYLREKSQVCIDAEDKKNIIKNIKALMLSKIGGIIVVGTDNLIISSFVGTIAVGLYSNYFLITNALNMILSLLFQSVTASLGNLAVTDSKDKQVQIFDIINFIGFWLYGWLSICLIILVNDFISLWLGNNYLFSMSIVIIIIINFYLSGIRLTIITFKEALGLYSYVRYRPIFEAIINFAFSIFFVRTIGVGGVFIGTILSTLLACLTVEPIIVFKYGFNKSAVSYYKNYLIYTSIIIVTGGITYIACKPFSHQDITSFSIKTIICIFLPNIVFLIIFSKTKVFKYLFEKIKMIIKISMKKNEIL